MAACFLRFSRYMKSPNKAIRRQVGNDRHLRPLERLERLNAALRGLRVKDQNDTFRVRKIVGGTGAR